ncbi:MAG: lysophospholipid acyltransferase family protein [Pseudomonadota bacterium]
MSTPSPAFEHRAPDGSPLNSRDLSYAQSAKTRLGRAIVRGIENMTGRPKLVRAVLDYQRDLEAGNSFWEVMWERFQLKLDLPGGGLANIPKEGPLVCVANHPYGILDGLAFGTILQKTRPDFKILANQWLVKAPEIDHQILPIDRSETREALRTNLATRRTALEHLRAGGCIAVFPGGTIAAGRKFYKPAFDPDWKTFTATMIRASKAPVLPMLFEGQNSRMFQIASSLNSTLRLALLISEFEKRVGDSVRVIIGEQIGRETLETYSDPRELMNFLRSRTYSLSPQLIGKLTEGRPWG